MSQNIPDESQTQTEQPTGADLLGKMTEAIGVLNEAQEHLVDVAKDVAKHTTDPNAHGAATLANIAKALPTPVLEDGMFTFKDAAGKPLMEAVNIKGDPGEQGEKGEDGEKGDMPDHRWNGTALQVQKPDGSWGDEQDLQGPKGLDGADGAPGLAPAHEWDGTSLKFKNPDGTWGEAQDLQGAKGEDGSDGAAPEHEWNGTSLKFKNPDGTWGEEQNLQGPKGAPGDAAIATAEQPGIVRPDGATVTVDEGLLSALGGNLLLNSEQWLLESGTFTAPVTSWYELLLFGGGQSGTVNTAYMIAEGGNAGSIKSALIRLEAGQEMPVTVGAGGVSPAVNESIIDGGATSFGEISTEVDDTMQRGETTMQGWYSPTGMPTGINYYRISGAGLGGGFPEPIMGSDSQTQAQRNAMCNAAGHFGGGGAASLHKDKTLYAIGAGAQGSVRVRWHDPAKAAGPLPAPALFAARRMARVAAGPATVNLYDPETGQGSVWREEDAEAKLAEGLVTEEAWLAIRAERAAEARAAWLVDPDTEAERFELLRMACEAKLTATDKLTTADYPISDEDRAAVDAYRKAIRELNHQPGAPWDGGGELTPWPAPPAVSKVQV